MWQFTDSNNYEWSMYRTTNFTAEWLLLYYKFSTNKTKTDVETNTKTSLSLLPIIILVS